MLTGLCDEGNSSGGAKLAVMFSCHTEILFQCFTDVMLTG